MLSLLSSWWKPIAALVLIALLVLSGVYLSGVWYSRGAQHQALIDKAAADKTELADSQKITEAQHADDQELLALRAYRDAHPPVPVSVRVNAPSVCSKGTASTGAAGAPAASAVVQPVPAGDTDGLISDTDRGAMLQSLAAAGDQLSAQLRALQSVQGK